MFTRLKPILILLALIVPSVLFFFKPGIYWNMHDDMQLIRQLEMEKCLQDGQVPCRWTPDLGYGYGYPLFNFYPPLPYYVGQIFRTIGFSFISTIKLTAALQFFVAGLAMYLLSRSIFGTIGGLISALLYTYAPYHSVNVYIRGAMNEAWASVFFPLTFYFAKEAIVKNKYHYYLLLAFSYSGLLLSHNPMALTFSPFLAVWILFWLLTAKVDLKSFFVLSTRLFFALIASILISAYFTIPVLFESKLVQIESMFQNYYHFSVHFVSLKQLFISNFWGDGPSLWGTEDGMSFSVGYIHWAVALLTLFISTLSFLKKRKIDWIVFTLFFLSILSIFLTHERSTPIWNLVSIIQKIQFPWRFLNIATFLTSLLAGSIVIHFKHTHTKIVLLFTITSLIFTLYSSRFTPVVSGPITDEQKFSGKAWVNQVTGGIYDYLPKTSAKAATSPAKEYVDKINLPDSEFQITGAKKGTDWMFFNISLKRPANISLGILYYPGFQVLLDNKPISIYPDSELGRITFDVPSGEHQVYVKLHDTPIRTISNYITLFTLISIVSLTSLYLWKLRK